VSERTGNTVLPLTSADVDAEIVVDEPELPAPGHGRLRFVFFPLAAAGLVLALVLGVRAAHDRPDLSVSDARVHRDGLQATVQVTVHNRSHDTLCPTIQIAARNTDGLDLDKLQGAPVNKTGTIKPGQTVGFKVLFTDLTKRDYEKLDKFVGYVDEQHTC